MMSPDIVDVLRTGQSQQKALALLDHLRSFSKKPSSSPAQHARAGMWDEAVNVAAALPEDDAIVWKILLACIALRGGETERAADLIRTMTPPQSGSALGYAHARAAAALLPEVLPPRPEETLRLASALFWASQLLSDSNGGVRSRELQHPLNSFYSQLCRSKRFEEAKALLGINTPGNTSHLLRRLVTALVEDGQKEEAKTLILNKQGWIREEAIASCVQALERTSGIASAEGFARECGVMEFSSMRGARQTVEAHRVPEDAAREGISASALPMQLDELVRFRGTPFTPCWHSEEWIRELVALGREPIIQAAKQGCRCPAVAISSVAAFLRRTHPDLSLELAIASYPLALESNADGILEDALDDCVDVAHAAGREDLAEQWIEAWLTWRLSKGCRSESGWLLGAVAEIISTKKRFDLLGRVLRGCSTEEASAHVARNAAKLVTDPEDAEKLARLLNESRFPVHTLTAAILGVRKNLTSVAARLAEVLAGRPELANASPDGVLEALVRGGRTKEATRIFQTFAPAERSDGRLAAGLEAFVREGELRRAIELAEGVRPIVLYNSLELLADALAVKSDEDIDGLIQGTNARALLSTLLCTKLAARGETDRVLRWLPHSIGAKRPQLLTLAKKAFEAGYGESGDRLLLEAERSPEMDCLEDSDVARRVSALCEAGRPDRAMALLEEHPSGYAAWQGVVALLDRKYFKEVPQAVSIFLEQTREEEDPTYTGYQVAEMAQHMAHTGFSVPNDLVSIGVGMAFRVPDVHTQSQYLSQFAWALIECRRWREALPILDHMAESDAKGQIASRLAWETLNADHEELLSDSGLVKSAKRSPSALIYLYRLAQGKGRTRLADSLLPTLLQSEETSAALLSLAMSQAKTEELEELVCERF